MPMDYRNFARINGALVYDPEGRKLAEQEWPKKRIIELEQLSKDKKVTKILTDVENGMRLGRKQHRILDQLDIKYEVTDEDD
tara:strand:- start:48 stop:293 length:246 start_codon:yes stop_codon:yes gene_type:complete